ncbi:hypothetical protein, partial [Bacteroides heparinolyticus]|uniref:hypothetical protein n=1 Tax=Prevotella heparinolytica TaxID=28113 RepID=UPI0035A07819
ATVLPALKLKVSPSVFGMELTSQYNLGYLPIRLRGTSVVLGGILSCIGKSLPYHTHTGGK